MPSHRTQRVAEMIHRELAQRLRTEVKDPELTPISITRVEVSGDLSRAMVYWLPLGGGTPAPSLVDAVGRAARTLRGRIGRALRLRHAPELRCEVDQQHDAAVDVLMTLRKLEQERVARGAEDVET